MQSRLIKITQFFQQGVACKLKYLISNKENQMNYSSQVIINKMVQHQNFMKKSNNFVSGSTDKSIIIWYMNQNNQWKCQQKLDGHSDAIGVYY
ncbi:unnamed protein product [Paramecium pentaurelia]|uniref:Uncharacterized protein n=1 Tax=Paramecium pentaurelia TaxID=43138 RepID=A0A8S1YEV5_9CILI|nr:unnamed protein product [Paramecium pentaurelia]